MTGDVRRGDFGQESKINTSSSHSLDEHYQTRVQARASLFEYINVYYNRQRRHSTIGYMTPEKFEATMATMDKVA